MARKNPEEFTSMGVPKTQVQQLVKLKAHYKEPLWEVIDRLLKNKSQTIKDNGAQSYDAAKSNTDAPGSKIL